jgi:hypothetical protein
MKAAASMKLEAAASFLYGRIPSKAAFVAQTMA